MSFFRKSKSATQVELGVEYFFYFSLILLGNEMTDPFNVTEAERMKIRNAFFVLKDMELSRWLKAPTYGLMYFIKIEEMAKQFTEHHFKRGTTQEIERACHPNINWESPLAVEVQNAIRDYL